MSNSRHEDGDLEPNEPSELTAEEFFRQSSGRLPAWSAEVCGEDFFSAQTTESARGMQEVKKTKTDQSESSKPLGELAQSSSLPADLAESLSGRLTDSRHLLGRLLKQNRSKALSKNGWEFRRTSTAPATAKNGSLPHEGNRYPDDTRRDAQTWRKPRAWRAKTAVANPRPCRSRSETAFSTRKQLRRVSQATGR
jgi:hypothetical protein